MKILLIHLLCAWVLWAVWWCVGVSLVSLLEFRQWGEWVIQADDWGKQLTVCHSSAGVCTSRHECAIKDELMLELSSCQVFLIKGGANLSWDTYRHGWARRVGSITRRGQWRQWPSPALSSEKAVHACYVRPLALVGILWNYLHN